MRYKVSNEHAFTQYSQCCPFFRAVISEKGIVPPGTLGRFLAAYGWNTNTDDLEQITVSRLQEDGSIAEQKVNFAAIAKAGDAAKDFALQWGDVIEIPPAFAVTSGSDSLEEKARAENNAAVVKFLAACRT